MEIMQTETEEVKKKQWRIEGGGEAQKERSEMSFVIHSFP